MAFSLVTYNSEGDTTFDLSASTAGYSNFSNVYSSNTTFTFPAGMTQHVSVTEPLLNQRIRADSASGDGLGLYMNLNGSVQGNVFSEPSLYYTTPDVTPAPTPFFGKKLPDRTVLSCVDTHVETVGFRTASSASDFGLLTVNSNGLSCIDQEYRDFIVHPDAAGNKIRYGVAESADSSTLLSDNSNKIYEASSENENVSFGKAYDKPPLIVIKSSSNYIALLGFTTNAEGKYVGATIVANRIFGAGGGYLAADTDVTATFEYLIVSDEPPITPQTSDYGLEVYDQSGNTVFTSQDTSVSITSYFGQVPYIYSNFNGGANINRVNSLGSPLDATSGYVINSHSPFCGILYKSDVYQANNSVVVVSAGWCSFYGRYLYVPAGGEFAISRADWSAAAALANTPLYSGTFWNWVTYDFYLSTLSTWYLQRVKFEY